MQEIKIDIENTSKSALKLTSIFLCLSVAWIVLSDFAVDELLTTVSDRAIAQTVKGILFVLVTTILVYWLSKRAFTQIANNTLTEQAAHAERLLNTVMANLGEAVIFVGPKSRTIVGCNSAAESMLGYTENELIGRTTRFIHENDESFHAFGIKGEPVLEKKGIFRCQHKLRHKDGQVFPVEITVVVLDEALGWNAGVVSIIRDLSAQKQWETELRESEERYRLLAENTLDVIWQMNIDMVFTYVNPAIENMTGYTPSEFIGSHLQQHLTKTEMSKMEDIIKEQLAEGPSSKGIIMHTELLRADKSILAVEVHGKIVFDENGQAVSIQGVTRDITQRRVLEASLQQSQKMEAIGTFAGGIAHELNNPLNAVLGFAELIAEIEANSEITDYCSEIVHAAEHMQSLIRDLLGYARTDESKPFEDCSLKDIVESTLSLIRTIFRHENIELLVEFPKGLPGINCRPQQIQQVVMNLVTNSRDALNKKYADSNERKWILIKADRVDTPEGKMVQLIVEDNGTGLSEQERSQIFEPFFTTKPKGKGTGLGMWVLNQIVQEHKGNISIETGLGEFARFKIDLPAAREQEDEYVAAGLP